MGIEAVLRERKIRQLDLPPCWLTAVQIRRDQPQWLSALFEKTFGDWRIAG